MADSKKKQKNGKKAITEEPIKEMGKMEAVTPRRRNEKGRFVKGDCGGPGRPAGTHSQVLQIVRAGAKEIWPDIIARAKEGDQHSIDLVVQYGTPKAKHLVDDPDSVSAKAQEILAKYKSGEVSLKDTALELEINGIPLPDTIRILLGKEEIEPDDPNAGVYCTVDEEEFARRAAERQSEIFGQREQLPELRQRNAALHTQVADSHAPGAMPVTNRNGAEDGTSD